MFNKISLLVLSTVAVLAACGGGGGGGSSSGGGADTTPPQVTFDPSSISVISGGLIDFDIRARDASGVRNIFTFDCDEGRVNASALGRDGELFISVIYSAPSVTTTSSVSCFVRTEDTLDNQGTVNFNIEVRARAAAANAPDKETRFGPCYDTGDNRIVRQVLTLTRTTLESRIESSQGTDNLAPKCELDSDSFSLEANVEADLAYISDTSVKACQNALASDVSVDFRSFDTGDAPVITSKPEISERLDLISGGVDLLPSETQICELKTGGLRFGDVEYTREPNSVIISLNDKESAEDVE